jgi:antitoxin MazE
MRIEKLGDDLAVRLPAEFVKKLGLAEGDDLHIVDANDKSVCVETTPSLRKMIDRLRAEGKLFPADYKFTRADAYEGTGRY